MLLPVQHSCPAPGEIHAAGGAETANRHLIKLKATSNTATPFNPTANLKVTRAGERIQASFIITTQSACRGNGPYNMRHWK
ncbi:MAG: hypothetical protein CVU43_19370 [Chloroflexi bacterium HGW-Chloroflexi-5]|jgi:hypothetical protein|nr:MAG: hypothetical protein CVU54_14035 [Deltaproteobacteria bacterium HGW-Deltaproteobacteria-12]PKN96693.1 MAG: hypothetical protein CVU43_19370 [Chloroflexi bacterium HGW-Chloroflexi-5]